MRRHREPAAILSCPDVGVAPGRRFAGRGGVAGGGVDDRKIAHQADFDVMCLEVADRDGNRGLPKESGSIDQRFVGIGAIKFRSENFVKALDVGILHGVDVVAVERGQFFYILVHCFLCSSLSRHCEEQSDEAIHSSVSMCGPMDCFASLAMTALVAPSFHSQSSNPGGGTKPPNSRSINSASLKGVRSSSQGPRIWAPMGKPSGERPIGIAVAGRPGRLAIPGHAIWSG